VPDYYASCLITRDHCCHSIDKVNFLVLVYFDASLDTIVALQECLVPQ
jgi:hypothetical protein